MDGNMYNVIRGLHTEADDCGCTGPNGAGLCQRCMAVQAALAELETVDDWHAMSAAMDEAKE